MDPKPTILIKVYGTASCPQCQGVKNYLHSKHVIFDYIDVHKDDAGMKEVESLGVTTLPVITTNGKLYTTGFSLKQLNKLIEEVNE